MDVANSFLPILQVMAVVMTEPTAQTFRTLVAGWLLAPRRTIIGIVRASGTERHHAAFHRFFATAKWSIDRAGLAVFDLLTRDQKTAMLAVDDTLLPRFGLKIFGAGMHRDAVLSSRSRTVVRFGHCWVVLCVIVESRHFPGRHFALPVLSRLYLNTSSAEKWNRQYHTKNELMLQMLSLLERHVAGKPISLHLLGDSAFTVPFVLNQIPDSIEVTGRAGGNYRVHGAPRPHPQGQAGRPPKRGARLATPQEMLQAKGLSRMVVQVYEHSEYHIRVTTQIGRFYKAPDREVLVIAVEHLRGGRGMEFFYTTDLNADVETVLRRYAWRWSIEVMFHETKSHLGIDEPQNRTTLAARRTAATGFLLYSLVVWWHETACESPAASLREWPEKQHPSFADMLAELRAETLQNTRETYFSTPEVSPAVKKFLDHLQRLLSLAA